jgi:hypothetical protein
MRYLILLLISFSVQAEIYLDLSMEAHYEEYDSFRQRNGEPIKNLIGSAELGYTDGNYSVFVRHSSSVQQEDMGMNTIGIKFRVIGKQ